MSIDTIIDDCFRKDKKVKEFYHVSEELKQKIKNFIEGEIDQSQKKIGKGYFERLTASEEKEWVSPFIILESLKSRLLNDSPASPPTHCDAIRPTNSKGSEEPYRDGGNICENCGHHITSHVGLEDMTCKHTKCFHSNNRCRDFKPKNQEDKA